MNLNLPENAAYEVGDVNMEIVADFFLATPEDALQYESLVCDRELLPPDRFQIASYKNITPLAVEILWAILRHEQWNVKRHGLEHVSHTEETWLRRLPSELVHRLSALNEAEQNAIADAWARTKDVHWSLDELRPVLRDLQRLAIQAQATDRGLYLYNML